METGVEAGSMLVPLEPCCCWASMRVLATMDIGGLAGVDMAIEGAAAAEVGSQELPACILFIIGQSEVQAMAGVASRSAESAEG